MDSLAWHATAAGAPPGGLHRVLRGDRL